MSGAVKTLLHCVPGPWRPPGGRGPALAIGEDEFLPPEQAFKYTATADRRPAHRRMAATKGYYLYKKRMGLAAATPGVTVGESVYPQGRDPQGRVLRRAGSLPRHVQGHRAAHGREGRRHDCAQAQMAGLRRRGPVLSAERLGRQRQGRPGRSRHHGGQDLRPRQARRSTRKTSISIRTWPSCSRPTRSRLTTSSSTGASRTATTSTSSASSSSPPTPRSPVAPWCCRRARITPTNTSASRKSIGRVSTHRSRCRRAPRPST